MRVNARKLHQLQFL